ncbi:MAG: membrane protein insertion efficiency factor YidD [candidate division KSB1 bacterium]|nr:membrane protein insertion efficiency factor YidD [candidate division KSB1 bacterium]MDZ7275400.1 membrane protein insertion efficiency factor YidD [candidate division KSB1 bacterium]MDZ7286288.1 membrane protein insertion efficiency factor YidD [candidate division KSB1 bacterium]MDZ7296514.1 membrane protein insertion efficiency factor YidD [candidate division KSB1 bacterium]MDZ7305528.1 membrane protein insertion efficiency factor YidD [candidate division KSB1 bacterium]
MRSVIILWIQLYRNFVPEGKRRRCLFRESCSHHVERIARERGSFAAITAFLARARHCRPGYGFEWDADSDVWFLVCANGAKIPKVMVSEHILSEYQFLQSHFSLKEIVGG